MVFFYACIHMPSYVSLDKGVPICLSDEDWLDPCDTSTADFGEKDLVIVLDKDETGGSLFDRLAVEGANLLITTLQQLEDGTASRTKQDDTKSSYAKMLTKDMGNLDFSKDAVELERLIRGLNPWPSAYTHFQEKLLKIYKAEVITEEKMDAMNSLNAQPGTIVLVDKKSFVVRCKSGGLRILNLQLEGKKRMDTAAFLLGNKLEAGMQLS